MWLRDVGWTDTGVESVGCPLAFEVSEKVNRASVCPVRKRNLPGAVRLMFRHVVSRSGASFAVVPHPLGVVLAGQFRRFIGKWSATTGGN
jgi:hypothetical protein